MLFTEMTLIAGLSLVGAAVGYGGWWIFQRWRPMTMHPEDERPGEFDPSVTADPQYLHDDDLPGHQAAAPEGRDLSADLEEIRIQLREIAKAQLSLLESERDRPERTEPDPRIDLVLAEIRLHSETRAATEIAIGEQLDALRDDIRVGLDEVIAASARPDPRMAEVVSELASLKATLNEAAMNPASGDLLAHLALVGEDIARVLAAVSDTARAQAIDQDVVRRIDQLLDRIPAPAVGGSSAEPGPAPPQGRSAARTGRPPDNAAPQPRGLAYIPPRNSGVVTVLNPGQQDHI